MTTANISRRRWRAAFLGLSLAVALPVLSVGDTIKLKDGSSLRGRVITVTVDSLTIETNFGSRIRVPRSQIVTIVLDDSLATLAPAPTPMMAPTPVVADSGYFSVTFRDRKVSSKIKIYKKKDWDGHIQANWIVQEVVVDGTVVHAMIDSSMDKTIYKGQTRVIKNSMVLPDIEAVVPSGVHQVVLVVRNYGAIDYAEKFDDEPLYMEIHFDNLGIGGGETTRAHVGITRGKLRMGRARFYHVK